MKITLKKSLAALVLSAVMAVSVASPAEAYWNHGGYYHGGYYHGGYWHAGYYAYGRVAVAPYPYGYYYGAPAPVVYANPYAVYAAPAIVPVGVSLNIR